MYAQFRKPSLFRSGCRSFTTIMYIYRDVNKEKVSFLTSKRTINGKETTISSVFNDKIQTLDISSDHKNQHDECFPICFATNFTSRLIEQKIKEPLTYKEFKNLDNDYRYENGHQLPLEYLPMLIELSTEKKEFKVLNICYDSDNLIQIGTVRDNKQIAQIDLHEFFKETDQCVKESKQVDNFVMLSVLGLCATSVYLIAYHS
jgi:hypothetical protein